jgi:hypothetical protein
VIEVAAMSVVASALNRPGLASMIADDRLNFDRVYRAFKSASIHAAFASNAEVRFLRYCAPVRSVILFAASIARWRAEPDGWCGDRERELIAELLRPALWHLREDIDAERLLVKLMLDASNRAAEIVRERWGEIEALAEELTPQPVRAVELLSHAA